MLCISNEWLSIQPEEVLKVVQKLFIIQGGSRKVCRTAKGVCERNKGQR